MRDHRFRLCHCSAVIPWLVLSRSLPRADAGSRWIPRATFKCDRDTIYRIVREKISHGNANARRASSFISARRAIKPRSHRPVRSRAAFAAPPRFRAPIFERSNLLFARTIYVRTRTHTHTHTERPLNSNSMRPKSLTE